MNKLERYELYGGKVVLLFDPVRHNYLVNGIQIIGVTTVTSVIEKPALINWAVYKMCLPYLRENLKPNTKYDELEIEQILKDAGKQHTIKKEAAATAGTMVHAWAEQYIKGKKPKKPKNPQLLNGVNAFLAWRKEHNIEFLDSEKKVYSRKYNYAGTVDAVANIDGNLTLLDWKTSSGLYDEMRLQVAAYLAADREETGRNYKQAWIARFDKETGEFESKMIPIEEHEKDFVAFLGALTLKKRLLELKRERV